MQSTRDALSALADGKGEHLGQRRLGSCEVPAHGARRTEVDRGGHRAGAPSLTEGLVEQPQGSLSCGFGAFPVAEGHVGGAGAQRYAWTVERQLAADPVQELVVAGMLELFRGQGKFRRDLVSRADQAKGPGSDSM